MNNKRANCLEERERGQEKQLTDPSSETQEADKATKMVHENISIE